MTDSNLEAQSLFDTARAIASLDKELALDMVIKAHQKAMGQKAKAAGELSEINSKIRLLGSAQKKAKASEQDADAIIEKVKFLIATLEASL